MFKHLLFELININNSLEILLQEHTIKQLNRARPLASFGFQDSPDKVLIVLVFYFPKLECSLFNNPLEFTHIFCFERMSSLANCIHHYTISPQVDLLPNILFLANQLRGHVIRCATNSIAFTITICLIKIFLLRVLNPQSISFN